MLRLFTLAILVTITVHYKPEPFTVISHTYKLPSIQEQISQRAYEYKVSPILMYAIIDYESSWYFNMENPHSSSKQLHGFVRGTTKWVGLSLGYNLEHGNVSVSQQIECLAWYLSYLNKKYDGDLRGVLKEYCGESTYYDRIRVRMVKFSKKKEREKACVRYK